MLGQLLTSLDDPMVAIGVLVALNEPSLSERVTAVAGATGHTPADVITSTVRDFLDTASDDHWLQLVGIMNRAEDPGLSAVRAILNKALPEHVP